MKICSKCKTNKNLEDFNKSSRNSKLTEAWCKDCKRKQNRESSHKYKESREKAKTKTLARNRQYVLDHLSINPCIDCGESDVEVLQFDHINMVGKTGKRVGDYITGSLEGLQQEIEKCEVRCANCHIKRTRKQTGWSRGLLVRVGRPDAQLDKSQTVVYN